MKSDVKDHLFLLLGHKSVLIQSILFIHIQGAVALLSARTKLLEPQQIDLVEGRVAALLQKLNQAAEKKDAVESAEKQTKVNMTLVK